MRVFVDDLTRRQRDIYEYLLDRDDAKQPPPTLDEMCTALSLKSRGSLHKHVHALTVAGLLEPADGRRRGVRIRRDVLPERGRDVLPMLGYIAAGVPIEAIPQPEEMEVPRFLRTDGDCFLLKVRGDSMIEAGILDGDWVVIEKRDHARNGEIVVALIDETEATLKRIQQKPGRVILYPANSTMKPQKYTPLQVRIQGVLKGQMRVY